MADATQSVDLLSEPNDIQLWVSLILMADMAIFDYYRE
jgi:hypothetical protein